MTSLSQANNPTAFTRSAVQFNVSESDFFLLESLGITTYDAFALRVPSKDDLEEFIRTAIVPNSGYKDEDGRLVTFPRAPAIAWVEFCISEDAAALRKLWQVGKEISKAEVERLATGDESSRGKIQIQTALAMESASVKRGMPRPGSDVERPSLFCLTKTAKALIGPNASYTYIQWENYISMEEESVLIRANKMPKDSKEVVISGDGVKFKDKKDEEGHHVGEKAEDLEAVRKYLDIRSRTMDMLDVATFHVYKRLHEKYISKLVARVPHGMRAPTVEETRRFDRTLHEEILRWVSRGAGSLDEGLIYHMDHEGLPIWKLLDPVVKSLPDQGVESEPKRRKTEPKEAAKTKPEKNSDPKGAGASTLKKCLVCGERHSPFCALPEGFRKAQREKEKERKAQQKKAAAAKKAPKTGDH